MSFAICFNLEQSKILSSGNGLKSTFCTIVAFVANVDQDQTVQKVQSNL